MSTKKSIYNTKRLIAFSSRDVELLTLIGTHEGRTVSDIIRQAVREYNDKYINTRAEFSQNVEKIFGHR